MTRVYLVDGQMDYYPKHIYLAWRNINLETSCANKCPSSWIFPSYIHSSIAVISLAN